MNLKTTLFSTVFLVLSFFLSLNIAVAQEMHSSPITIRYADGSNKVFEDIDKAFEGIKANCTMYISTGRYSATTEKEVTVPVKIYGACCRPNETQNYTLLDVVIKFKEGSSNSVVMGLKNLSYIKVEDNVRNVLIKHVDLPNVYFFKTTRNCLLSSSVIRQAVYANRSPLTISNCVVDYIYGVVGGSILNSIIVNGLGAYDSSKYIDKSTLRDNVYLSSGFFGSNCNYQGNISMKDKNDTYGFTKCKYSVSELFLKYNYNNRFNLVESCDYHFKPNTLNRQIGIYGGNGFDALGRSPVPIIFLKDVASETDASGNLKMKIKVLRN